MTTLPKMKAIIVDGKIINHEALKRFYAERYRRQEIIRAGTFADIERMNSEELEPPKPVESQPWQADQWRSVQQLKGMVLHLDKQVKEALAKKKKPSRYQQYKDA